MWRYQNAQRNRSRQNKKRATIETFLPQKKFLNIRHSEIKKKAEVYLMKRWVLNNKQCAASMNVVNMLAVDFVFGNDWHTLTQISTAEKIWFECNKLKKISHFNFMLYSVSLSCRCFHTYLVLLSTESNSFNIVRQFVYFCVFYTIKLIAGVSELRFAIVLQYNDKYFKLYVKLHSLNRINEIFDENEAKP